MTDLNTKLGELLKEVEDEMDDLGLYAMELNFTNHMQGLEDGVNKLAFRKLQIEKWLITSIMERNYWKSQRLLTLFCNTIKDIVQLFQTEKLKVVDMEGEIVSDGGSVFLSKTMKQIYKYQVYIEYIKLF
jgi:hypothetical protein